MYPEFLASEAIRHAQRHSAVLNVLVIERLALGHIAQWLFDQDAPTARAAEAACEAVRLVHAHFA